jgi:hypothetical protein
MKRCLLLLVALATTPSIYALPPGEFPLAPFPKGPAPYERRHPEVAAGQNLFLAVWEDARVAPNQPRIWAARVGRSGAMLDPTGFPVATLEPNSPIGTHLRSVASDGIDFLVAWGDEQDRLGLAKVTGDGQVIALPNPVMSAGGATIVWLGDVYAIFVNDGGTMSVSTVGRDGRVIRRSALGLRGVKSFSTAMNFNKTLVYLGWLQPTDGTIRVAPIAVPQIRAGAITPPPVFPPGEPNGVPDELSIASNGGDVLAAWIDTEPTPNKYRAQFFDSNGFPLGPLITLADASSSPVRPTVIWNGLEYVVTYKDADNSARLVRIATDGTFLGPPMVLSGEVLDVTIGTLTGIDDSLVVWNELRGASMQMNANILAAGAPVLLLPSQLLLSTSFADRSDALVVWRGDHYLGAWRDLNDVSRAVVGRFNAEGQPLDGTGTRISTGASAAPPVMASNGRTAVVAWLDLNGVASSFVDEAGRVSRLSFDFPGGQPAVNWNGQQYLVAWRAPNGQLLALRVSASGALLDTQAVTVGPVSSTPFIGWTGNSYVVVFTQEPACFPFCNSSPSLWAQLVSASLVPVGSPIQLSQERVGTPALADGPGGTLVVWPRTVGNATALRGARIFNGAILDPLNGFDIGTGTDATVYASVAGWGVVSGPYLWTVSRNGAVAPRQFEFPFVPVGAHAAVVLGGPAPLVVYRREPVGAEQMMQVVARYFTGPARHRVVRR